MEIALAHDMTDLCSTRFVRFMTFPFGRGGHGSDEVARGAADVEVRQCAGLGSVAPVEPVASSGDLGDERAEVSALAGPLRGGRAITRRRGYYEAEELSGLFDRRLGKASTKRVPVNEIE